jgi:glycosyltransferase involved in cell wall biosynthesis
LNDEAVKTRFGTAPGIRFFGFRPESSIRDVLRLADFSVMPSRFLETFGLSALESLSAGTPVVAFDKGGLSQFVFASGLGIADSGDDAAAIALTERLVTLSTSSDGLMHEWKVQAFKTAKAYSLTAFREKVCSILPETVKKILLVTDFSGKLGGIETYVPKLAEALVSMGYEVRTVSKPLSRWDLSFRIATTLAAFCNVKAAVELRTAMREFDPDAVWCHSVLRRFGGVGILPILFSKSRPGPRGSTVPSRFAVMTYHDLGYFAASAADVRTEADVPNPGFFAFLSKARGMMKIPAIAKHFKLAFLFLVLRRFDRHVVPSAFMERFVSDRIPDKTRVSTLPHFTAD